MSDDPLTRSAILKRKSYAPFSSVKAARDIIRERAEEFVESYIELVAEARSKGNFDVAEKALWKLIEHAPAGTDGERVIDASAAKPKEITSGPTGPTIQIGISLGQQQKSLPEPVVIDIAPLESNEQPLLPKEPVKL